jgi:hypothetical protein
MGPDIHEGLNGVVDAEKLVVFSHQLKEAAMRLLVEGKVLDQIQHLAGSHAPRMKVSREMMPSSPSLVIFFQSLKWSQLAVMLPTLLRLPLDRMINALYQKIWGIVSCSRQITSKGHL